MKKLLYIAFAGLLSFGCKQSPEAAQAERAEQKQRTQATVNEVIGSITYMKDPRTSICYAYYWGGTANGGPALAVVPSQSVPTNLLWIADVQTNLEK